jgi:putative holliday junction resolvase
MYVYSGNGLELQAGSMIHFQAVNSLGLDVGTKRIGVALCEGTAWASRPLTVLQRHGGVKDLEAVARLVLAHGVSEIVVGLPINMDGSEGRSCLLVRRFAAALEKHLEIPIRLWDERLTTWEAEGILKEREVRPSKRRGVVDKVAAALILKSYLEANPKEANTQECEK